MADRPPPHRLELRVYYEDTDAAGIVYHARYLCFMERARTEFLRALGMDHRRLLADHGCVFTVRRMTLDFARPARLDDRLEVVSTVREVRGARLALDQEVRLEATLLVRGAVELAVVDARLRPRRLPPALARTFAAWSSA